MQPSTGGASSGSARALVEEPGRGEEDKTLAPWDSLSCCCRKGRCKSSGVYDAEAQRCCKFKEQCTWLKLGGYNSREPDASRCTKDPAEQATILLTEVPFSDVYCFVVIAFVAAQPLSELTSHD